MYGLIDPLLPSKGKVLELGAGVGHGVVHLLGKGLEVIAVDAEPESVRILRERAPTATVIEARFEKTDLPLDEFDAVVAGFCLFFLSSEEFNEFWPRLVASIKSGGIFAGQFLGPRDGWAELGYLVHQQIELKQLLASFEIQSWEEVEQDGTTSQGVLKHWHVYHIVARKNTI